MKNFPDLLDVTTIVRVDCPNMLQALFGPLTGAALDDISVGLISGPVGLNEYSALVSNEQMIEDIVGVVQSERSIAEVETETRINPIFTNPTQKAFKDAFDDEPITDANGDQYYQVSGISHRESEIPNNDTFLFASQKVNIVSGSLKGSLIIESLCEPFELPDQGEIAEHFTKCETFHQIH